MTDEELLISTTLSDNWNTTNAPLPKFYSTDEIKLHDFKNYSAIKIYLLNSPEAPKGLGYTSYQREVFLTVDIRTKDRTSVLQIRDEVKRIIKSFRKSLTGYDICKMTHERKVNSYINYYQFIIEISLLKYRTTI